MARKLLQRGSSKILIVGTVIVLITGVFALVLQMQQRESTRADGTAVVGGPSLPAASVDAIFTRVGSPMAGTGQVVEEASRQANVDDAFALAVWWVETNDGAAGVGRADRNPGSVRGSAGYPSAFDGYTIYPSYADGITDWFNVLKNRYISRGLTSVYAICYPYVGTSSAALWAGKVTALMLRYHNEAPPPTPTPTPVTPTPTPILPTPTPVVQRTNASLRSQSRDATMPEVSSAEHRSSISSQQPAVSTPMAQIQPWLIGLCTLLVLALAILAIKLSKRVRPASVEIQPAVLPAMQYSDPMTPPPLFVNEYSPVLVRETTSLLMDKWSEEVQLAFTPVSQKWCVDGQLDFPPVSQNWSEEAQLDFAPVSQALASSGIENMPLGYTPTESAPARAAAGQSGLRRRRLVQLNVESQTEQVEVVSVEKSFVPVTQALPSRPGRAVVLPDRVLEPVGTASGGLLSRYGNKKPT